MENALMFPDVFQPARTTAQQLKIVMNLPVRFLAEGKEFDILPGTAVENLAPIAPKRVVLFKKQASPWMTPNEMIDFFSKCEKDDLLYPEEVSAIYSITKSTLLAWVEKRLIRSYRIVHNLTLYKRSELPTLTEIFGPFEHA